LNSQLRELANKIHDKTLRKKTITMLRSPTFEANGKTYSGMPLEISPAGRYHHHSYPGGYIEHVVSATNIALALCESVEKTYHGKVSRDLVIAGMLLHDIFKPATYSINKDGTYGTTPLADHLDHLLIATSELVRRDFPLELIHIVSAHHGDYGPIKPRTLEALVCHLADFVDSRLNGEVLGAAAYMTKRVAGHELFGMTSSEAFEIVHSKSVEGWEGVARTIERLSRKKKRHKP
jgi:putative nucleotidyltransferase with HDIG domain